jgi:hypothetical protein
LIPAWFRRAGLLTLFAVSNSTGVIVGNLRTRNQ